MARPMTTTCVAMAFSGCSHIKDSDVRVATLEQCRDAVDKSLHAGGAFSATIPLVALYYGGFMDIDVVDPTKRGQDLFVLSKGHAVAALASIYADLGYFDRSLLRNSRSHHSILNGHPGAGAARVSISRPGRWGRASRWRKGWRWSAASRRPTTVYCLCGDGELQEGPIWEGVMYAGQAHLDNLCVMVDHNHGQLDLANRMVFTMPHLETVFESFGWEAVSVDATQYDGIYRALEHFRYRPAQRTADGDHLPHDQGPWRVVGGVEQAQGDGARRAHRTGDRPAAPAAPRS